MPNKLRCAVYTRVSTEMQAVKEYNSCQAQEEKIKAFIKSQDTMQYYKTYEDAGFTGSNTERPALREMMYDVTRRKIDIVLAYKVDRLTRSTKDFYGLVDILEAHNAGFISVTERFDTSTAAGRLMRNMMLTFAQFERELTGERTRDKLLQRAAKGMWNGGFPPYGYTREKGKLVIDDEESKIVKTIFETYIETGSTSAIYNLLHDKGIKKRKIKSESAKEMPITKGLLQNVLRNTVYTGRTAYNGKTFQGQHERLISDEMFQAAQELRKDKKKKFKLYKKHVFSGLIQCVECGHILTPTYTNKYMRGKLKRYFYYRCTTTTKLDWKACSTKQVNADRIENMIFSNLSRMARDEMYLEGLAMKLNNEADPMERGGLELSETEEIGKNNFLPPSPRRGHANFDSELFYEPKQMQKLILKVLEVMKQKATKERNLQAKNYVKKIFYGKEWIEMELFYFDFDTSPFSSFSTDGKGQSWNLEKTVGKRGGAKKKEEEEREGNQDNSAFDFNGFEKRLEKRKSQGVSLHSVGNMLASEEQGKNGIENTEGKSNASGDAFVNGNQSNRIGDCDGFLSDEQAVCSSNNEASVSPLSDSVSHRPSSCSSDENTSHSSQRKNPSKTSVSNGLVINPSHLSLESFPEKIHSARI